MAQSLVAAADAIRLIWDMLHRTRSKSWFKPKKSIMREEKRRQKGNGEVAACKKILENTRRMSKNVEKRRINRAPRENGGINRRAEAL